MEIKKGFAMKKVITPILISALFVFFAALPVVAVEVDSGDLMQAGEEIINDKTVSPEAVLYDSDEEGASGEEIEYSLPYPGILADHPLYFLKKLRDQIMSILITDPVKKIEFLILQSDKFLSMANVYAGENNWEWVAKTVELSFQNAEEANNLASDYKKNSTDIPGYLVEKIKMSAAKHLETVNGFATSAKDGYDKDFEDQISAMKKLQQKHNNLSD
ncbi:hypothetical protein ACFL1A_01805 [Patescibacteria group bacterium]